MDSRLSYFYRQYLQQVDVAKLSFPPAQVLMEPLIQSQMHLHMFTSHLLFPSEGETGRYLPLPMYQKHVLKVIVSLITSAVRDPHEDEVSDNLMQKLSSLSAAEEPSPLAAAEQKARLTYTLPYDTQNAMPNSVFISESPNILTSAGNTGLRTWEASLHLATYLATEGRSLVGGRSVLELGVGAGLLSIICAGPLSAAYVLATDGDDKVQDTIRANIALNYHLSHHSNRRIPLEAKVLSWGPSADLGSLLPSKGGNVLYDTILGADITYDLESLDPLASMLKDLADLCPGVDIIISATIRNEDTFDLFLALCLDRGLSIYDIDFRCPPLELQKGLFHSHDPLVRIVRIKKER